MSFSVIIPSRSIDNLVPCVEAARKCEPEADVLVVDDSDGTAISHFCREGNAVDRIDGVRPFVFSRNVNHGVLWSTYDNVVVLNDDALLKTPGGFSLLEKECQEHPEIGIIGATTNVTGAAWQMPQNKGLRLCEHFAFICVYIPARTLETVGLLDERFVSYGWEDRDYCLRVTRAGLKCAVHDGCYVDHGSLHSTFRGAPRAAGNISEGRKIFIDKWGFDVK